MLRITLYLEDMTWADLRAYVAINRSLPDVEKVGVQVDETTDEITGLYEFVPADEVKPRGE